MTHETWARRVDALIVEAAPGLRFALDGRTPKGDHEQTGVRAEDFRRPHWRAIPGFIEIDDQGHDRQARALYVPISIESGTRAEPPGARTRFYDREEAGARKAASDIVTFLRDGVLPANDE